MSHYATASGKVVWVVISAFFCGTILCEEHYLYTVGGRNSTYIFHDLSSHPPSIILLLEKCAQKYIHNIRIPQFTLSPFSNQVPMEILSYALVLVTSFSKLGFGFPQIIDQDVVHEESAKSDGVTGIGGLGLEVMKELGVGGVRGIGGKVRNYGYVPQLYLPAEETVDLDWKSAQVAVAETVCVCVFTLMMSLSIPYVL